MTERGIDGIEGIHSSIVSCRRRRHIIHYPSRKADKDNVFATHWKKQEQRSLQGAKEQASKQMNYTWDPDPAVRRERERGRECRVSRNGGRQITAVVRRLCCRLWIRENTEPNPISGARARPLAPSFPPCPPAHPHCRRRRPHLPDVPWERRKEGVCTQRGKEGRRERPRP